MLIQFERRTEHAFDAWIVVKEREKNRNAFHNRALQLLIDIFPVVVIPALNGFQLLLSILVNGIRTVFMLDSRLNPEFLQNISCCGRIQDSVKLSGFIGLEASFSKFPRMRLKDFARNSEEGFPKDVFLGLPHLSFEHLCGDRRFIDIEEGDVTETDLMQDDDELNEVRVCLLPERFFALAKQIV